MSNTYTATEILATAIRVGQVDLFFEDASAELATRARAAIAGGFLLVTDEGEFNLTAKGAEYVAGSK